MPPRKSSGHRLDVEEGPTGGILARYGGRPKIPAFEVRYMQHARAITDPPEFPFQKTAADFFQLAIIFIWYTSIGLRAGKI